MKIKNIFIAIFTLINLIIIQFFLFQNLLSHFMSFGVRYLLLFSFTIIIGLLIYKTIKKEQQKTFLKIYAVLILVLILLIISKNFIGLNYFYFILHPNLNILLGIITTALIINLIINEENKKTIKIIKITNIAFISLAVISIILLLFISQTQTKDCGFIKFVYDSDLKICREEHFMTGCPPPKIDLKQSLIECEQENEQRISYELIDQCENVTFLSGFNRNMFVTSEYMIINCYKDFAIAMRDKTICEKIVNPSTYNGCLIEINKII